MPAITVAVTAYNLEKYLPDALSDLMGQTFQDFELIVYDDCSSDKTRNMLWDFFSLHPGHGELLLGAAPLRTAAAARNAILDSGRVHGKYLLFLDGDDRLEPELLERLYNAAEGSDADIAICAYDRFESETGHVLCLEMRGFPQTLTLPTQTDTLAFVNTSLWNKLVRTDCIGYNRIPTIKIGEDLCFNWSLYLQCKKIAFVDEVLLHYRVHATSAMSNVQEREALQLAGELEKLRVRAAGTWAQPTLELVSFIHIGISMPLRAYDNAKIDRKDFCAKTRKALSSWYTKSEFLKLRPLSHHGVKGFGVWGVKLCWQLHCFGLFRALYVLVTRVFHIDIKF